MPYAITYRATLRPMATTLALMLACGSTLVSPLGAQENAGDGEGNPGTEAASSTALERVEQLDARIAAAARQEQSLQEEILKARKRATDLDRKWQGLAGQVDRIRAEQQELEAKLKELRETEAESLAKHETSLDAVETARQKLEEAQARLVEAEEHAEEANEEVETAAEAISETETELTSLGPKLDPLKPAVEEAREDSEQLHQTIGNMEAEASQFTERRQSLQQQVESLLRDAEQWVSFSDQIAPIFHQQCIACHNARNPQGRYNMTSYAAVMSESESGVPIEPRDAELSLLFQAVADGWMPHESDPLPDDQVELIRRWIDLGARLDSSADPDTPLIRIMPRVTQPDPPDQYRVPIPVTAVATDPSGQWLASSGYHEVLLWSLPDGELVTRISNVAERVGGLAFHPDGRRLAVASGTPGQLGEVKLFDRETGELLEDRLVSEDAIFAVAFSPEGDRLAACGADGTIAIFDVDDAAADPRLIDDHADWVNSIAWSPNGKRLVSASRDKTAKVFDAETGELLVTFGDHDQNVTAAVFLSDNERVVSGGEDRKLRVWQIAEAEQQRDISGFRAEIGALVRLDDNQILSITTGNQIRLHDAADGKLLQEFTAPSRWLSSLTVADDQQVFLFGDQAGQIHRATFDEDGLDGEEAVQQSWLAVP